MLSASVATYFTQRVIAGLHPAPELICSIHMIMIETFDRISSQISMANTSASSFRRSTTHWGSDDVRSSVPEKSSLPQFETRDGSHRLSDAVVIQAITGWVE